MERVSWWAILRAVRWLFQAIVLPLAIGLVLLVVGLIVDIRYRDPLREWLTRERPGAPALLTMLLAIVAAHWLAVEVTVLVVCILAAIGWKIRRELTAPPSREAKLPMPAPPTSQAISDKSVRGPRFSLGPIQEDVRWNTFRLSVRNSGDGKWSHRMSKLFP